jgi:uncharacterized protein YbjQ (UPF0145 family)
MFVSNYSEEVRAIVKELRNLARSAMHGAHEFLYYDAISYSLDDSPLGRICYISPMQTYVTIGFLFGARLNDQHHMLQGIGKRARHVKIRTFEEARNPAIKELIKEAWTHGADPIPRIEQRTRQRAVAHHRVKWFPLKRHFSHAGRG